MGVKEELIELDDSFLPQMAELYRESFGGEPWNDDWSDGKQLMEYIREISGSYHSLNYGLLIGGKLEALSIGMIRHWWEGTNYNIEELCVSSGRQGQGVGTRFLKMIEHDIRDRGLAGIFLQTDTDKPAYGFYQKCGFKLLDEHVSFYKRMKKAIIFDLDGTLWDATGCSVDIWNNVFDKHEDVSIRMTKEISSGLMGKTMPEIGAALFPDMTEEARMSIVDDFGDEEVKYLSEHGAVLYDGVEEALSSLEKDYDLYIVSNCQDGYVPAFLHAHNLAHHFKDIEMSGRTGMDKGKNIKLLMERNGIKNAVYVGDTEGDENAARYAGIPFIWASYGFGKAKSPDRVIRSIKELVLINLLETYIN